MVVELLFKCILYSTADGGHGGVVGAAHSASDGGRDGDATVEPVADMAADGGHGGDSLYMEHDRQLTKMEHFFKERREAGIREEIDMLQMVGYFLLNTYCLIMMTSCLLVQVFFLD